MKCKAYVFANASDYDMDDISEEVTFAETAGKAKQDFSIENGIHYKDTRNVLMSGYTGYKRKLQHFAKISCNCCKKRNSSKHFEKVKEMKGGRRIVKNRQ